MLNTTTCKRGTRDNRYDRLSNGNAAWQEIADQINGGADVKASLKRYYFFRTGEFSVVCEASDAACVAANNPGGRWEYITDQKVQVTISGGAILFYDVVKIDASNLWLQDNNTRNQKILRKLVVAR